MKTSFGVTHTLAEVSERISMKVGTEKLCKTFNEYVTNAYKLSFLKTHTGLHFIIISSIDQKNYHAVLRDIYKSAYIEYVCKNPLATVGQKIETPKFTTAVRDCLTRANIQYGGHA